MQYDSKRNLNVWRGMVGGPNPLPYNPVLTACRLLNVGEDAANQYFLLFAFSYVFNHSTQITIFHFS